MSTLSQLKSTIADDIGRSDLTTQIADEVTRAIEFYGTEQFYFLEGRATLSTVANQEWYAVPDDYVAADNLLVTLSGSKTPLTRIHYSEIDEEDTGIFKGQPSEWAYYQDNIRLYPIPDAIYTLTLSYRLTLDPPSDTGSNAWTTVGFDLIRARAEKKLYRHVIKDLDSASVAESTEITERENLISDTTKKISTGKLKKSGW